MKNRIVLILLVLLTVLVGGCGGVKLDAQNLPAEHDLKTALDIQDLPYIKDDTFIANPFALLGQVVEVRKKDGACPADIVSGKTEFSIEPIAGFKIDEKSILAAPVKRDSKIVNRDIAASVSFLSYLSAELDQKSVMSLILFDQTAARVNDKDASWSKAISTWKTAHSDIINNKEICYLWVVRGVVQKNIIRKKFTELKGSGKADAYGVNVGGQYYSGSEDYSVDVKFGLSPGVLKRPAGLAGLAVPEMGESAPTAEEIKLFDSIKSIEHRKP